MEARYAVLAEPNPPESVAQVAESAALLLQSRSLYARRGKRFLDVALGVPLLLLFTPVILLAALVVLVTSGWPVFYGSSRVGKNGRPFRMWKIRSMVREADRLRDEWTVTNPELATTYRLNFKIHDDPRVTRLGRVIRRTSIDELPQLLNVVRGDMSLVGPRPYFASEFTDDPELLEVISAVRPGITGPWQVRGRNAITPSMRMAIDCEYAGRYSVREDVAFLLATLKVPFKGTGV